MHTVRFTLCVITSRECGVLPSQGHHFPISTQAMGQYPPPPTCPSPHPPPAPHQSSFLSQSIPPPAPRRHAPLSPGAINTSLSMWRPCVRSSEPFPGLPIGSGECENLGRARDPHIHMEIGAYKYGKESAEEGSSHLGEQADPASMAPAVYGASHFSKETSTHKVKPVGPLWK